MPAAERSASWTEAEYVLSVTMVYQDLTTRQWTTEMWDRVAQLAGQENIHAAAWKISDLASPGNLADAVGSAARADVVVVAVSAARELPLDLYVWFDLWLPRRARDLGALVVLIGLPEAASHQVSRAQEYFQAAARKGGLDFFPQQRTLPASSPALFDTGAIAEAAEEGTAVQPGIVGGADNCVCQDWGINE